MPWCPKCRSRTRPTGKRCGRCRRRKVLIRGTNRNRAAVTTGAVVLLVAALAWSGVGVPAGRGSPPGEQAAGAAAPAVSATTVTTTTLPVVSPEANRRPVVVADDFTSVVGAEVSLPVLDNDDDPDANLDPATLRVVDAPAVGDSGLHPMSVTDAWRLGFRADREGTYPIVYEVCDALEVCGRATVTVVVVT